MSSRRREARGSKISKPKSSHKSQQQQQTQKILKRLITTSKHTTTTATTTSHSSPLPANLFKLAPNKRKALLNSTQHHALSTPHSTFARRSLSTSTTPSFESTFDHIPEYDEKAAHRKKPKPAVLLADGDSIMKVFGNPLNEDPTEPIIRSVLPNGIVRATGIENPRLGAYITIHLSGGANGWDGGEFAFAGETTSRDRIQEMKKNKDVNSSMQPTIVPKGGKINAEIIRITKHEIFLAVPCSPHLINVEDRVSKNKDTVPGFKVPVTVRKGKLLHSSIPDDDERADLNITPTDPSLADPITPLLGSVLNAFGDQLEQVKKPVVLGDEDLEERVNFDLKKNHTVHMPYSNTVARRVLRSKLKALPYVLNSQFRKAYGVKDGAKAEMDVIEGKRRFGDDGGDGQIKFQQLYKSSDESVTYSPEIDMSEADSDYDDNSGNGSDEEGSEYENKVKSDPFMSLPLKRSKLNSILQKNKHFVENLILPPIYRANSSSQLLTGIPAIDMFNPIRKGSRMLFTSTDSADLTNFGQTVFRNTLLQASQPPPTNPNQLEVAGTGIAGAKEANPNITPIVQSEMFSTTYNGKNTPLTPESLTDSNTIGIYCAIGKTAHGKDTLVKFLDPVMKNSVVIFTNDNDTPYTHTQAVKQAIGLSNALRVQGKDVIVVLDDLAHHSGAVMKLNEPFNMAMGSGVTGNHHAVNSAHAALLDSVGVISLTPAQQYLKRQQRGHGTDEDAAAAAAQNAFEQGDVNSLISNTLQDTDRDTFGSSTVLSLFTSYGENATPSLAVRQSHQVLDGLKSIVDRHVPFHDHLQASRFWPPIEVQPMHPVLPTISPVMRPLMQQMNARIIESQHLFEYAQVSESLGITIDFDVEQVIEWKAKVQALLMQSPTRSYSLAEQYITAFSAAQDRILAGIEVVDIPTYKRHLVKSLYKYPTVVNIVANIVNVSTELPLKGFKRKFTNPQSIYNDKGEMVDANGTPLPPSLQLSDDSTRELMKKQALQPFLDQVGVKLSPIDEFICSYSTSQMDLRSITDFTRPLFKPVAAPDGHFEQTPDAAQIQYLVQRIQKKYGHGEPTQTEQEKAIFDSMLKGNTLGKYGLPIIVDELLQVIVDDAHESFLSGSWKIDPAVEAMTKLGTKGMAADTTPKTMDVFGKESIIVWDDDNAKTADGMTIEEGFAMDAGIEVFDPAAQSMDLPLKPDQKPKDHLLNVGIAQSLGLGNGNPEAIIEQTPKGPKWWPF